MADVCLGFMVLKMFEWPFQLLGHLTTTLYAVAEIASDLIKKRYIVPRFR